MTTLERTADLAAVLFHAQFADPTQSILFMMNLAIAGGFLVLAAREAGDWSVDARRATRVISQE